MRKASNYLESFPLSRHRKYIPAWAFFLLSPSLPPFLSPSLPPLPSLSPSLFPPCISNLILQGMADVTKKGGSVWMGHFPAQDEAVLHGKRPFPFPALADSCTLSSSIHEKGAERYFIAPALLQIPPKSSGVNTQSHWPGAGSQCVLYLQKSIPEDGFAQRGKQSSFPTFPSAPVFSGLFTSVSLILPKFLQDLNSHSWIFFLSPFFPKQH